MNEVLHILQQHKEALFKKYPLKSMALFGSYSRGEQTEDSDVDVMVELNMPDVRAFINLHYELERIAKKKIDLVSRGGVKDRYFKIIEKDILYV
ncbi:MAG: nucleotidyltransferase domain-containing protein [Bacteroidota bacterium]